MLTDGELTLMREEAEQALPDMCSTQRATQTSDGGGGTSTEWLEHLAFVPCRLSPVAGGEASLTGGRIADEATCVVTVAWDTDVVEADRLIINGAVYDVQLVRQRGEWALTTRIECREAA